MSRFIGVDFSGGARPWRQTVSKPTVWLATLQQTGNDTRLQSVIPVQQLPGTGTPFDRLVKLIAAGEFDAATIDAPFSLPSRHLPPGGHPELLRSIRALPNASDRDFPLGSTIVLLGQNVTVNHQDKPKPLRETERYWAERGVNTRSTMWSGTRGGAPFTAACLRLLELAGRPIWPGMIPSPASSAKRFQQRNYAIGVCRIEHIQNLIKLRTARRSLEASASACRLIPLTSVSCSTAPTPLTPLSRRSLQLLSRKVKLPTSQSPAKRVLSRSRTDKPGAIRELRR